MEPSLVMTPLCVCEAMFQHTARSVCHALHVVAVQVHRVQFQVAFVVGGEENALAIWGDGGLGSVARLWVYV